MSPPTFPALNQAIAARAAAPSSSSFTTTAAAASTPTTTTKCNHESMPDLSQIPGLPQSRSVWAIPNWPESLAGMTACCNLKPDNEVHIAEPDRCALWCFIPDEFLFERKKDGTNGKRRDGAVAADAMGQCVRNKGNVTGAYITVWQVKEGGAPGLGRTGKMMSLKRVVGMGVWGVVVWGVLG
ncbi:hypothetical protein GE21DRAFT_5004 [Neurospora crassa]|uniref:Uncharacterized protein n=1 Tax=Neurospora crassa (strain ATCC 24698 / 74-OR23-1A / CBS 708.71 / DSM 1257 / FGSC 987) TaxID=367110 RepID=Q7S3L9_NEUCR|nr:hypothetical protein NCU08224 [Neurospora crassa OR74A]EAA30078.2 hypothetical protein NCU08224 [Neurospora crassa OR74A]KHE86472.1 hypothetical protein GE21DRAFT_5004 [Neurospora crassa]|eukprot:XP_959314.2 hypothetical protein NCU08224 [Neurospora crassa OR74A]